MLSKRPNENQVIKRIKTETNSEIQRKISDLSDDCLEMILKFLNHSDLLNVADVSKRFTECTKSVYKRKYGYRLIINDSLQHVSSCAPHSSETKCLFVSNLQASLKLLRNFGELIQTLSVTFNKIHNLNKKIKVDRYVLLENYIMKYCSQNDSLKELKLYNCRRYGFERIEYPFQGLEVFYFDNGYLGTSLSDFNRWFPKLRHLELKRVKPANKNFIQNFSHLEHLAIFDGGCNIDTAISMNSQLQSINFQCKCFPNNLESCNQILLYF